MWNSASSELYEWVERFRHVFIKQQKDKFFTLFSERDFGLHNGMNATEYAKHEFQEFIDYGSFFGLRENCEIECYHIKDNFFYFSLGEKKSRALFEGMYQWSDEKQKAIGNQYNFKIEPKMQFIMRNGVTHFTRRINITPHAPQDILYAVLIKNAETEPLQHVCLPAHLGGDFYYINYHRKDFDDRLSYWDNMSLINNIKDPNRKGRNIPVFMRGVDHPLFIDNLFPKIQGNTVTCPNTTDNLYVLQVVLEDGDEFYYKYPEQSHFNFNKNVIKATITDTLSYDWITHN